MTGLALLLAASAMGVDFGWRPHEEGGTEYIIQIEPEVFASLEAGGDILSEIHPDAQNVRRFRIRIGRGPLPREVGDAGPDDGPLPPAPPGDATTPTESAPTAKSTSTNVARTGSPPLNHLAQGSGYGSPFGGYSGGYTRSTATGASGASATDAASRTTPATSGAGTTGTGTTVIGTTGSYGGSSRSAYSDYTGRSTYTSNTAAATGSTSGTAAPTASYSTTSGDTGLNRGEVRTASNQQTVTSTSTSSTGATGGNSTSSGLNPQYTTQGTTGQSGSIGQSSSTRPQTTTGATANPTTTTSTTSGQTQTTQQPQYQYSRQQPASNQTVNDTQGQATSQGQYGPITPVGSSYEDARNGAANNGGQGNGADYNQVGGWNAAPRQPTAENEPPPAYSPRNGYDDRTNPAASPTGNAGYANPGYSNQQYPPVAAPPLLPPQNAPPGNYGYAPNGYVPYQMASQPNPGYPYGQAPGYYAMPQLTPPVLTTASNNDDSSSKSRRRRDEDEDEDEDDYRNRRTYAAAPVVTTAPPAPATPPSANQGNIVTTEPWLAFTVTILLLFASVGGNIYLLWISQDFYWRYKELANDLRNFNSAAS